MGAASFRVFDTSRHVGATLVVARVDEHGYEKNHIDFKISCSLIARDFAYL